MWSISDIKQKGKEGFKNNYWGCVLSAFILAVLTAGSSMTGQTSSVKNIDPDTLGNEQAAALCRCMAYSHHCHI